MEQQTADRYKLYGSIATGVAAIITAAIGWYDSNSKAEASKEKSKSGYEVLVHQVQTAEKERAKLEKVIYTLQGRLIALENAQIRIKSVWDSDKDGVTNEVFGSVFGDSPPPPPPEPVLKPNAKKPKPEVQQHAAAMPNWEEL